MKIAIGKNEMSCALTTLGKLINRLSPKEEHKAVWIETGGGVLQFSTHSPEESATFKIPCEPDVSIRVAVYFDALRSAVRSCKGKMLEIELESNRMQLCGQTFECLDIPWSTQESPQEWESIPLADNFIDLLMQAAPIVNRNEARKCLQGMNLSRDGITVTNGRELLNIPCRLDVENLNLPFPLVLLNAKPDGVGRLLIRKEQETISFVVSYPRWTWRSNTLAGNYPNWKQIIPGSHILTHSLSLHPKQKQQLEFFLKSVPDNLSRNAVELSQTSPANLRVQTNGMTMDISAEFAGDWNGFFLMLSKENLLRLLSLGHTKIETGKGHIPLIASGGTGRYVAMPLHKPNIQTKQIEPVKEENKMENTKQALKPEQAGTPVPESESVNPMDELNTAIESFRAKLKSALDESAALSRKVKEVSLAQKQKERDFIMAKRAIERIRMVSGF